MPTSRTSLHRFLLPAIALAALAFWACPPKQHGVVTKPTTPDVPVVQPDPVNVIHVVRFDGAKIVEREVAKVPESAFSREPFEKKRAADEGRIPEVDKIHPYLRRLMARTPMDERVRVLINFRDDLQIPRFPEPFEDQPRDSPANRAARDAAKRLIADVEQRRARSYGETTQGILAEYKAKVVSTFWLINGVSADMPLAAVEALAQRDDVLYIEPENAEEKPPDNGNPNDDVDDGRRRIVSDPYFNLGQTNGWIGLLDTGARFTHTLFNSPSHIAFRFDCTDGTCNGSPDPTDDCWNHGTKTAAIITGNGNLGNPFRGVTGITLDSFKVYPAGCGFLSATATVKAFQTAVSVLDRVIIAEMQSGQNDTGSISTAADNAFDAGAVIIAANGNNGPSASTVNAPAIAHKVIGVGNFDVQTLAQVNSESRGPAPDNRFKPDIQTPTNTETASSSSNTAVGSFSGTSGATPYAGAAAALLRNWLRGNSGSIDPGQVYAQLILSGSQPYPFNNTSGAGPLRLPTDGWGWWGKVTVTDGGTIEIPISVPNDPHLTLFDGALWWPETTAQTHSDVDLYLIDPTNAVRDSSVSIPSVFERARAQGSIPPGTWKVRIRGYRVPAGSQTVYWTAAAMRR